MNTGYLLNEWAIMPRSLRGLLGIPISPFLHDGVGHLLSNTLPFAILGSIVMMRNGKNFLYVSLLTVFFGGILVWILGRSSYHLGASVLIFGYFGYLLAAGWYQRTLASIAVAVLVFVMVAVFKSLNRREVNAQVPSTRSTGLQLEDKQL